MSTSKKTVTKTASAAQPAARKPAAKQVAAKQVPAKKAVSRKPAAKAAAPIPPAAMPAPATAPTTAPATRLRIFQIYYRPEQRRLLDPDFEPYNNQGEHSPLLEFQVFRKLAASSLVADAALWGALSWKFQDKTGMSGRELKAVIAAHPGHDIYFCNPFPELEAQYHNLWLHGETAHPNFLLLSQEFFEAAGLDTGLLTAFTANKLFAAANYFVATPAFWKAYLAFVERAVAKAEAGMSRTAKAMIFSSAADRLGVHAGASYLPFIVERLLGVFLATEGKDFKAHKFALPAKEADLNVHLNLLRQMKNVAMESRSLWMATCWVNYRNLYMQNQYGSEWCKQYLKKVTPADFKA